MKNKPNLTIPNLINPKLTPLFTDLIDLLPHLDNLDPDLPDPTEDELQIFLDRLARTFNESATPRCYFTDNLGSGAYKTCYAAFPGWVIKFVSEYNDTEAEERIYAAATWEGVYDFFVESYFFQVPVTNFGFKLENDDGYTLEYTENYSDSEESGNDSPFYTYASHIILQRRVTPVNKDRFLSDETIDCTEVDKLIAQKLPASLAESIQDYGELFLKFLIKRASVEKIKNLNTFIKAYDIFDLHSGNLGLQVDDDGYFPVILDWLS